MQGTIENNFTLIRELGVPIATMKNGLGDMQAALAAERKFSAELEKCCATRASELEARSKARSEELRALAETVKALNEDDALELFKKTVPSASNLLQVGQGMSTRRDNAMHLLRSAKTVVTAGNRPGLKPLMLALKDSTGSGNSGKIIAMFDNLVAPLSEEQTDDDIKKEFCQHQFDQSDHQKEALERAIVTAEASVSSTQESIATLANEIVALGAVVQALENSVARATAQQEDEHAEFKARAAFNTAAPGGIAGSGTTFPAQVGI